MVAPDRLLDRAREMAERLAAVPADTFRITKLQLRAGSDHEAEARAVWSRPDVHAHIAEYLSRTVRKK